LAHSIPIPIQSKLELLAAACLCISYGFNDMTRTSNLQLAWAVILIIAGIGVFFRIPAVMPKIAKIEHFAGVLTYIRFCFYLIGVMLIGGGAKKLYHFYFSRQDMP
jgi:hypothetical protein